MIEKRFESQDNIILDAEGDSLKSIDEIVDVLNELDNENDFLYDNIIKFEKENEQLKKELYYHYRDENYNVLRYKAIDSLTIYDTFANKYHTLIGPEIAEEFCGLLNNYFNENNQLKQSIKKMKGGK